MTAPFLLLGILFLLEFKHILQKVIDIAQDEAVKIASPVACVLLDMGIVRINIDEILLMEGGFIV